MRSLLVWLDSHRRSPLSASQLLNDSSVFPRRLALIDSSLLLSGRFFFFFFREIFDAGKSYLCSFHPMVQGDLPLHQHDMSLVFLPNDRPSTICTVFKFSFSFFFFTVLEFPIHFTLWYGSQALSYLAIFLCVYFTYQNFSQFSMPRIISRTPNMVWLIWNTNRFTPFVTGNCASINWNLNCICCSSQITRKPSPILSLCNWFFELSYQALHLPLSWRESDIYRFNGRKKRKRDGHHWALTLPGTVTDVSYTWSHWIHLITLRDRCYYYSFIK